MEIGYPKTKCHAWKDLLPEWKSRAAVSCRNSIETNPSAQPVQGRWSNTKDRLYAMELSGKHCLSGDRFRSEIIGREY